jgi:predicted dehydrogenase
MLVLPNKIRKQKMKKLNYGFAGLNHGNSHIHAISKMPWGNISAICDLDESLLKKCQAEHNLETNQCYTDFDSFLKTPGLDVVVISTPVHTHKAMALKALNSGKHLFLEKSLAHTIEDGKAIVDAAEQSDKITQIGYCVRSSQLVEQIKRIHHSGQIGDIVLTWYNMFLKYNFYGDWRNDRSKGGGKLYDCCCHYFDMMFYIAESRFERVCAFGGPPLTKGINTDKMPKVTNVIIELENGVKSTLNLSDVTNAPRHCEAGVVGTKGKIAVEPYFPHGAGSLKYYAENSLIENELIINGELASTGHLGFSEQHASFYQSVTENKPVVCTARDALDLVYLNKAIDMSLSTGKVISRQEVEV